MQLVQSTTKKQPPPRNVYVQGDLKGFYSSGKPIQWRVDDFSVYEMMDSIKVSDSMLVRGEVQLFGFDGPTILSGLGVSVRPVGIVDGDFTIPKEAVREIYLDLAKVVHRYLDQHYDHFTFDHDGKLAKLEMSPEQKQEMDKADAGELRRMADNTLAAYGSDDPIAFVSRLQAEWDRTVEAS
jgi:hypothetical protein